MTARAARAIPPAMLSAFTLAVTRIFDRRLLPIWLKSLAVTLLACVALGYVGWWGLQLLLARYLADSEFSQLVAAALVVLAGWLLWRVVALAVLQFFADEVVMAIEARDYPALAVRAERCCLTCSRCRLHCCCWLPGLARRWYLLQSTRCCWGASCRTWSGCGIAPRRIARRRSQHLSGWRWAG